MVLPTIGDLQDVGRVGDHAVDPPPFEESGGEPGVDRPDVDLHVGVVGAVDGVRQQQVSPVGMEVGTVEVERVLEVAVRARSKEVGELHGGVVGGELVERRRVERRDDDLVVDRRGGGGRVVRDAAFLEFEHDPGVGRDRRGGLVERRDARAGFEHVEGREVGTGEFVHPA